MGKSSWPRGPPWSGNSRPHPTGRRGCCRPHRRRHPALCRHSTGSDRWREGCWWGPCEAHSGCPRMVEGTGRSNRGAGAEGSSCPHAGRGYWHSLTRSPGGGGRSSGDPRPCARTAPPSGTSRVHSCSGIVPRRSPVEIGERMRTAGPTLPPNPLSAPSLDGQTRHI